MKSHADALAAEIGKAQAACSTRNLRIRRCSGNRNAWLLCCVRTDGSESESYGSFTTSHSLDALLKNAGHLAPRPGDHVELIP